MKKIKNEKQVEKKEQNKNIELGSKKVRTEKGITILVLVITIVLNCSYLAMDQMNKIEKI